MLCVLDTSVLINFLKIDRVDLLGRCTHTFFVTDHVEAELSDYYADQVRRFQKGYEAKVFSKLSLSNPAELETFAELIKTGTLGAGECSAIAAAVHRASLLAIDDIRAIRRAKALAPELEILRTQDLMVLMIQQELLSIEQADTILHAWIRHHRYHLKIGSFQELLATSSK